MDLTDRQFSVYEFILHYHQQYGIAPTVREICRHFGLKGPAGVHRILGVLIEKGFIESMPGKKRSWRPVSSRSYLKSIPLLGKIAAGTPIDVNGNVEDYLPIDPTLYGHEGCFAVRVTGDSMIEAQIADGDMAIIVPVDDVDNNTIAAVIVEDLLTEATLKIFRCTENTIELHSANSAYPPVIFTGKDREKVRIVGRYVGLIRFFT